MTNKYENKEEKFNYNNEENNNKNTNQNNNINNNIVNNINTENGRENNNIVISLLPPTSDHFHHSSDLLINNDYDHNDIYNDIKDESPIRSLLNFQKSTKNSQKWKKSIKKTSIMIIILMIIFIFLSFILLMKEEENKKSEINFYNFSPINFTNNFFHQVEKDDVIISFFCFSDIHLDINYYPTKPYDLDDYLYLVISNLEIQNWSLGRPKRDPPPSLLSHSSLSSLSFYLFI